MNMEASDQGKDQSNKDSSSSVSPTTNTKEGKDNTSNYSSLSDKMVIRLISVQDFKH